MSYPRFAAVRETVLLGTLLFAACDGDMPTEPPQDRPPDAVRIEAVSETTLAGAVGTEVTPAPRVRALDPEGRAVRGARVLFHAEAGSIGQHSPTTGADGVATVGTWTLGRTAGTQRVTASLGEGAGVTFTAQAEPGPAASVSTVAGDHQVGIAGEPLADALVVRVADVYGNAVTGSAVEFEVIDGAGGIEGADPTDRLGMARSGTWTLGSEPGLQRVQATAGSSSATFSATAYERAAPPSGGIAFVSERSGDPEIYVVQADGSDLRRLTVHPGIDHAPAWSPDGSQIAFASDRGGLPSVWVLTAEGELTRRATGLLFDVSGSSFSGWGNELSWSPDGSVIAFATQRDGDIRIATVDHRNDNVRMLHTERGFNAQPAWSPDGRRLAFVSDREAYDFVFNIYTMNADGSGARLLTRGFDFWPNIVYYFHPTWSPDGSRIAYVYGTHVGNENIRFQVAVMSADGTSPRDVAWAGDLTYRESPPPPGSIAWSPDGRGLAYTFVDCDLVGLTGCSGVRSVNYVSLDGTRRGTIVANAHSPTWKP